MNRTQLVLILSCLLMPALPAMSTKPPLHHYESLAMQAGTSVVAFYASITNALNALLSQDSRHDIEHHDTIKNHVLKALKALDSLSNSTDDFKGLKDCALERSYILEALHMINQKVRTQLIKLEAHEIRLQRTKLQPPPPPHEEEMSLAARAAHAMRVPDKLGNEIVGTELENNSSDGSIIEELIRVLFMMTALAKVTAHDISSDYKVLINTINNELYEALTIGLAKSVSIGSIISSDNNYFIDCITHAHDYFSSLKECLTCEQLDEAVKKHCTTIDNLFRQLKHGSYIQQLKVSSDDTPTGQELDLIRSLRDECSKLHRALHINDTHTTTIYESLFKQKKVYSDEPFIDVDQELRKPFIDINQTLQRISDTVKDKLTPQQLNQFGSTIVQPWQECKDYFKEFLIAFKLITQQPLLTVDLDLLNQAQYSINCLQKLVIHQQTTKKKLLTNLLNFIKNNLAHVSQSSLDVGNREHSIKHHQEHINQFHSLIQRHEAQIAQLKVDFGTIVDLLISLQYNNSSEEVLRKTHSIGQHLNNMYELLKPKTRPLSYQSYLTEKVQNKQEANDLFKTTLSTLRHANAQKTTSPKVRFGPISGFFDLLTLKMNAGSSYCATQSQRLTHQITRIEKFDETVTKLSSDIDIPAALAGILQASRSPGALKLIEYCLQSELWPAQAISQMLAALAPEVVDTIEKQLNNGQPLSVIADELRRIISTFHLDKPVDQIVHVLNDYKPQVVAISSKAKNVALSSGKKACTKIKNKFDHVSALLDNNAHKLSPQCVTSDAWHFWCNSFAATTAFCALNLAHTLSQSRAALLYTVIENGCQNLPISHLIDEGPVVLENADYHLGISQFLHEEHADSDEESVDEDDNCADAPEEALIPRRKRMQRMQGISSTASNTTTDIHDDPLPLPPVPINHTERPANLLEPRQSRVTDQASPPRDPYVDMFQCVMNCQHLKEKDRSRVLWLQQILDHGKDVSQPVRFGPFFSTRSNTLDPLSPFARLAKILSGSALSIMKPYQDTRGMLLLKHVEMKQDCRDFKKLMEESARFPRASAGVYSFLQHRVLFKEQELWRHCLLNTCKKNYEYANQYLNKKEKACMKAEQRLALLKLRLETYQSFRSTAIKRVENIQEEHQGYRHFEEFPALFWVFDPFIWLTSYVKQRPYRKTLASANRTIEHWENALNSLDAHVQQALQEKVRAHQENQRHEYILQQISLMSGSHNEHSSFEHLTP